MGGREETPKADSKQRMKNEAHEKSTLMIDPRDVKIFVGDLKTDRDREENVQNRARIDQTTFF